MRNAIDYIPGLARDLKSINAAILYSYLCGFTAESELGVCLNAEQIEDDTALTSKQQRTARKILVDAGYVKATNKRLEHKLYFRVIMFLKGGI